MTSKKIKKIIQEDKEYLFQNYGDRFPVSFIKGEGSYLIDIDNKKYIDFLSGIAVSNLGYGNKKLIDALHNQIDNIIHTSNFFHNAEQIKAAKLLSEVSFPGKTLFVNSGTEANEAAIKLARKYGISQQKNKYQIISFKGSFHGRTFGSMSATGQNKIHKGFGPIVPGFKYLPYNDIKSFKKEIKSNKKIAAVIIELIQGEGGIVMADKSFVKQMAELCNKKGILLIVDEIQTGIGRTGHSFAYQHYDIIPDIITVAKGLGGGVPIGALHAKNYLVEYLDRGSHGSTFGGNHLAVTAAVVVLSEIKKSSFEKNISKISDYIFNRLNEMKDKFKFIKDVRGLGLHIGIEISMPGIEVVKKALDKGLIINCTAENVIRIMPPLNIEKSVVKEGLHILEEILKGAGEKDGNS